MTTYLLTWNPTKWEWKDLQENINQVNLNGYYEGRWSCGVNRSIVRGDRFFLIRLGKVPRGIFASGAVIRDTYVDAHWEKQTGDNPPTALYIRVRFDVLLDPDKHLLETPAKSENLPEKMHWYAQSSGITIPPGIAEKLENEWKKFLNTFGMVQEKDITVDIPEEIYGAVQYSEGAIQTISLNAYERNRTARKVCLNKYGFDCSVCGFNFKKMYGDIGEFYIHVHHLLPLSEIGREYILDPIKDLRPVCPNCHAMLHKHNPVYSIEELKKIIGRS